MDEHYSSPRSEADGPTWADLGTSLELLRKLGEFVPRQTSREDFFLDHVVDFLSLRAALLFRGELLEFGDDPLRMVSFHERGFDPPARQAVADYTAKNGQDDPLVPAGLQRMQGTPPGTPRAFRRRDLIADKAVVSHGL